MEPSVGLIMPEAAAILTGYPTQATITQSIQDKPISKIQPMSTELLSLKSHAGTEITAED
jgi:hypothetical protein